MTEKSAETSSEVCDDEAQEDLSAKEFSELVREHQNTYIKVADNKASILLSGLVAYFGLSLSVLGSNFLTQGQPFIIFASLSILSAIIGIYYAAFAVYPNTPETPQGLIMWESITSNSIEEYREIVKSKSSEELLSELIDENYELAGVNDRKYYKVRRAIQVTAFTIFFGVIAMVLLIS